MGYSNGGTLTLPSPTHVHHVDVTSAVKSLRRSLSRSPSKWALKKSPSLSPQSPLSPCLLSPKRSASQLSISTGTFSNPPHTPSPLTPFPPSAKLALRSSSRPRTGPSRAASRPSPMRPLSQALDSTSNLPATHVSASCGGQENNSSTSPTERKSLEKLSRMPFNPEGPPPVNHALSRLGGDGANDFLSPTTTSSPLKRSDAIMNLDQASLGSPVAKRRSLHGSASFGHDFNVFDYGPAPPSQFDIHDDSNVEYELSTTTSENPSAGISSMPRRSSSLRKSTLQQRHGEKTSWGRRHAAQVLASQHLANSGVEISTPVASKNRPRLSLDQFMPPMARDSPFASQGGLPNASMHMVHPHQPHPLSRTMTTSSSSSSIVDESPTHIPTHFGEQPRPTLDFSKSLPVGALRPYKLDTSSSDESGAFATPQNYKSVKPLPAAFMSTGLISKVNRNPEEPQIPRGNSKGNVPDTPCKKQANVYATYPAPVTGSAIARARHIRHSFGTPSTPFGSNQIVPTAFGQGAGVFGSGYGMTRRGSFVSTDGEDSGSPETNKDSQNSADFEMPPTPTKQAIVSSLPHHLYSNGSPSNHRSASAATPVVGSGLSKKLTRTSTSPLERIDFLEKFSPRTPQESMLPPDPSGLTISNPRDGQAAKLGVNRASMLPPSTPTTGRDYFTINNDRRLSTTPISSYAHVEIEESLSSRFDKVEMIGSGEFSLVYRVAQSQIPTNTSFYLGSSGSPLRGRTPPTPIPDRVFAVKKSRQPYQGIRDRQRKLQEVNVLKALGHSDHVVDLIDSWEENNHLYIQTEFCEEGSMDIFLLKTGRKGRLDDFRIWKIMLELSQGLRHIHDLGYIHLDLKPANIFITFEGVLKIGDFGMATQWPAQAGIEGEGDREYIGPEILLGKYDKPADVFALGLIMLEIAGNVQLPDNGPTWQRLRSGDMSDVPSLTSSHGSSILRDATGIPVEESEISMDSFCSDEEIETDFGSPTLASRKRNLGATSKSLSHDARNLFGSMRRGELHQAPSFMRDMYHDHALDRLVRWMISPAPEDRPMIHQIVESEGIQWVRTRRRAGATVFEGNWGPADDVLADDAEMMDV